MSIRQARISLVAAALFAMFGAFAMWDASRLGGASPWRNMFDFADFYCAGRAVSLGVDPYRYGPLHNCEREVNRYRDDPAFVVPMVLPTYTFPLLAPLGQMPIDVARARFAILNAVATLACVVVLALLGIDLTLAIAALLLSTGYLLLYTGQVVPFALLAVVLCGWALNKKLSVAAGVFAAAALIEPHLALPLCAGVFLFGSTRTRIALSAGVAVLACIAALMFPAETLEYVARVLPRHALADARDPLQYSLTYVLTLVGIPTSWALYAGGVSYIALGTAGIWLGQRLSRTLNRPEMVAFVPVAAVVLAGTYMHQVDICFAIPAALVLATKADGRARAVAAAALCLLAIPWILVSHLQHFFLLSVFIFAVILWRLHIPVLPAVATLAATSLALYVLQLHPATLAFGRAPLHVLPDDLSVAA
ncbi:MAG TPA: glycosyltransferase 87 family protein, partial [Candidatus Baltobacteraceae bacterium]|nr:glycosyltransferase 87 family protein [Candidatus Baltobacteraceae bacterium]